MGKIEPRAVTPAFYYCVACLSGIDEGTGAGSVINASSTLEISNAKAH